MSENQNFSFGKFIPGFDFLQDLAKGASQSLPQMPNLANWVAPTKARMRPIRKLIRPTIPKASGPHCCMTRKVSTQRN